MSTKDYGYRIGENSISTNGMHMCIIEYLSSSNITVQFEDGTVVHHKTYVDFKRGKIGYPLKNKIGDTAIANNGMKMTIIAYRKYSDIDIQFEDGTIVNNTHYSSFKNGEIAYPYNLRIGETIATRNGMQLKIIAYRSSKDIDVQFEDGTIIQHRTYVDFINRKIGYPRPSRIGECSYAKNGMQMTIIEYHNSRNIDIQFEDGTIVFNKEYQSFIKGNISNPNFTKTYIGEESITHSGLKMKIIEYRNSKDIDIQFEDGIILQHRDYYSFCIGNIKYPTEDRTGEENIATNGLKMKIIEYRNSSDIDIEFEDGAIVTHKSYLHFKDGYIGYPRPDHVGEENIASNGLKMKIIKYTNYSNIDIEFEDGTIVRNKYYQNFKKGTINYPVNRLYEENLANNGLKMKIVKYRTSTDIDIEFEDGTLVEHKGYKEFKRGQIGHPHITVHRSLPEKIICYFIGQQYDYIPSFKPLWLLNNRFSEDNKKSEFDIFIPCKKIAIEYDGVRFHQNSHKDNLKCKCVFDNNQRVNLHIRLRETGCPPLNNYPNLIQISTSPFSTYHKSSIEDLEKAITYIADLIELNNINIKITHDIIEYCKSEQFYINEQLMFKRLGL